MSGVLNRWKVAVQAAAFDVGTSVSGVVSTAVLGEEYEKNYEFPRDSTASGGHELLWKIYPAVSKKTGAEVSLFVFDKRELDKVHNKERVLDVLRHDMKTLRLLRHPQILKIEEVFDESRKTLSFVTERVTCSLANACKTFTNVLNVTPEVLEIGLSEFEIACGLMHIGESLSFLHREGRRVHLGLSPNAIFITPKGEWKLGGMGFSRIVEPGTTSRSEYYASGHAEPIKKGEKLLSYEPPLEYCAPELVNEPRTFDAHADVFSLGLLVLELFSPPKPDGSHEPVLGYLEGKVMTHGYKTQSLHPISFNPTVPVTLHNTIRTLLQLSPTSRIEARAFLSSPFFDSGLVKTLRTLQTLVEQDPASQAKFLLALPDVLSGFSPKVLRDLVLPGLQSVVINPAIAPFVITPLLKIVSMVDKTTFSRHIAPMMVPLLTIAEPVQCMLMFVENLEALIPKAEDGYIRDHIVPMLCRALDSSVPEILDKVLNKIVDQASLFEYRILKQIILPRVIRLILDPPQLSVRVNALLWLAKSFHVFDKDLLVESVMPCLAECLTKDKTPAVCMCILGCYDNLGKHLGPEYMAKLVLPAVSPLLWEKNLNGAQFDMVCERVNAMLKEIISEREKALMAESGLQTQSVATSGFGETVRAVERNKEKASGMAAVNSMLQDEYVPKAPESAQKPSEPAPYSDARPSTYSDRSSTSSRDDPFILNGGGRSAATPPKDAPSESYAERRRAKKANRRTSASVDAPTSDLLEIAPVAAPAYGNAPSAGLAGLSLAPAPSGNMFAGLQPSSYAPSSFAAAPPMAPSSGYGGTPGYGQNTAVSAFNGAPLLAAPPVAAPSYNNTNVGGYGNQFNAPPPAAPGYGQPQLGYGNNNYASTPYGNTAPQQQQLYSSYTGHPPTQDDGNKFSAFDGL
ncbi:SCY1 protein kinase [Saprolegnia diclina VS20]|uniref:SCY1 protein kinase n=1 Tax=Saprolegnia diclina (strain VS20) TaxID=1156394 RepID=T0RG67_SAPDV|nr:SCY1 protein kinase [Saprolegnia diclina VS20]EQC31273.1 SCY1 protein kinase [Saprolegnia diclina VS20]|eukprot:XP_008615114.1 SCY1 protein kinase [Saprolegnia diclina VS20]